MDDSVTTQYSICKAFWPEKGKKNHQNKLTDKANTISPAYKVVMYSIQLPTFKGLCHSFGAIFLSRKHLPLELLNAPLRPPASNRADETGETEP